MLPYIFAIFKGIITPRSPPSGSAYAFLGHTHLLYISLILHYHTFVHRTVFFPASKQCRTTVSPPAKRHLHGLKVFILYNGFLTYTIYEVPVCSLGSRADGGPLLVVYWDVYEHIMENSQKLYPCTLSLL